MGSDEDTAVHRRLLVVAVPVKLASGVTADSEDVLGIGCGVSSGCGHETLRVIKQIMCVD